MFKLIAFSFSLLLFLILNDLLSQNDLIVKGKIEIKSVGEGLSCGMTSQPSNYKTVILVKNCKDSIKTITNELNEFEFPPIDENDTFQIIFPFQHTNNYLNRTEYFTLKGADEISTFNTHRERMGMPILSDYEIKNQEKITQVYLNYALFCFLNKPYEPAGFKLHNFELIKSSAFIIELNRIEHLFSDYATEGSINIVPEFGFKIEKENLKPVYVGYSWEKINISDQNGLCHSGNLSSTFINCKIKDLILKIHKNLMNQELNLKKIEVGNNTGSINFYPRIMYIIKPNKLFNSENEKVEKDYTLKFFITNKTSKTLYFSSSGFKYQIPSEKNEIERIPISKGKTLEVFETQYAMNNPANHKTKPWEASFPKLFFESYKIQYGNTKLFLSIDSDWTLEKGDFTYIYTLKIEE
jgi:hypothetical protein